MRYFTLPTNDNDKTPLIETGFYQWALTMQRANVDMLAYLAHLGFTIGADTLAESDYEFLHHAEEYFHRCAPWIQKPCSLAELFSEHPATPDIKTYYVANHAARLYPSPAVFEALARCGWIYTPDPENTYFEVITQTTGAKFLFAKYQTIIGSRKICAIKEA